jgi:nitrogen-specific signal transduction histidine kinase
MKALEESKVNGSTLDSLLEGFQLIGYDWKYLYVNDALVKQSKFNSKSDLIGFSMMEKYPGIEDTEMFNTLKTCMCNRSTSEIENQFTFPDGSIGWFELRIEPVPDGLFIMSIDISDRKKAEKEMARYVCGLEEMLSMTSHCVRKPVANILGVATMLENTKQTKEELVRVIKYMRKSALILDDFTKELTNYMERLKHRPTS